MTLGMTMLLGGAWVFAFLEMAWQQRCLSHILRSNVPAQLLYIHSVCCVAKADERDNGRIFSMNKGTNDMLCRCYLPTPW